MSRFSSDVLQVNAVADLARRPTQAGRGVLLLPPVLAFLAGNLFYGLAAAALAPGASYLQPVLHARWDSWNYANIARVGYLLQPCNPATSPFSAADWCGTAGWFPLYPLGMRGLHLLGLSWPAAGWLLSELCTFGSLLLIWMLLGARLTAANLWCLALAVVFPGSIYYHAVFPISLVTFATLVLTYGSSWVVRSWLVAGTPARRWGRRGRARRRSPGPPRACRPAGRWARPNPGSCPGWPGRWRTPTGWPSLRSAAGTAAAPP